MYLFFDTETTGIPRNYKVPASGHRNWPRLVQIAMHRVIFILLLAVVSNSAAKAGALEDGAVAYERHDYKKALKIFRSAAQQGDASAQYNLGVLYNMGQGIPRDKAEALKWFRLAAQQGIAPAQFSLGLMYAKGGGVPLDRVRAYMWFILAVDSGSVDAIKARDTAAPFLSPIQRGVARLVADNCKTSKFKDKGCD